MRNISFWVLPFILLILIACGRTEEFGGKISDQTPITVKDVMTQTESYKGKPVVVEGKIVTECPAGCWFELKDESGIVYVDIEPSGLSIPQRVGRNVVVEGEIVTQKRGNPTLIGKKVRIK